MNTIVLSATKHGWLLLPILGALYFAFVISIVTGTDQWDRATVVKVCWDGTKVFRMEGGEYRVRGPSSLRSFHAEGPDVCAP